MGSFAMVWNEMMIGIKGKRGFAGNPLTEFFTGRAIEDENGNMSYTLPFMEDLLVKLRTSKQIKKMIFNKFFRA